MSYEEKVIDGIPHYRTNSHESWKFLSHGVMAIKLVTAEAYVQALSQELQKLKYKLKHNISAISTEDTIEIKQLKLDKRKLVLQVEKITRMYNKLMDDTINKQLRDEGFDV